jgi:hypothetical protein
LYARRAGIMAFASPVFPAHRYNFREARRHKAELKRARRVDREKHGIAQILEVSCYIGGGYKSWQIRRHAK